MSAPSPFFISSKGGSITCFRGDTGRVFRSCSRTCCVYSSDLHSAKAYLDNLESKNHLLIGQMNNFPAQRKTTLKWNSHGELTSVDMARVLERLSNPALTECDLACNLPEKNLPIIDKFPFASFCHPVLGFLRNRIIGLVY